jgi:hypothetical protein
MLLKRWFWDYFSIEIMFYTSMAKDKVNDHWYLQFFHPCWMRYVVLIFIMNELCLLGYWSSSIPCFISDLNSSHDLSKLNWEFLVGVSPTKYLVSTKAYFRLKNQSRHHIQFDLGRHFNLSTMLNLKAFGSKINTPLSSKIKLNTSSNLIQETSLN